MTQEHVDQAITLLDAHPDLADFSGPQEPEVIDLAENALGLRFPSDYRHFLSKLGDGSVGSRSIFGIWTSDFSRIGSWAVWLTLDERNSSNLPPSMIIINSDGMGGYLVLDANAVNDGIDPPVEVWEPGMSHPGESLEIVAPDFGSWFLHQVQEAITHGV